MIFRSFSVLDDGESSRKDVAIFSYLIAGKEFKGDLFGLAEIINFAYKLQKSYLHENL